MDLWCKNIRHKVFAQWSIFTTEAKSARDAMFIKLVNKPVALRCLIGIAKIQIDKKGKNETTIQQRMLRVAMENAVKRECY
jgi:hypothetical protein